MIEKKKAAYPTGIALKRLKHSMIPDAIAYTGIVFGDDPIREFPAVSRGVLLLSVTVRGLPRRNHPTKSSISWGPRS
jgi:hypothetical protein